MKAFSALMLMLLPCGISAIADEVLNRPIIADGKWYLTVVYSSEMSRNDRALFAFLRNPDGLDHLRRQVVFNEYRDSAKIISQTEWSSFLGHGRPALLLQSTHLSDGTGNVVFFRSGKGLAPGPQLKQDIADAIEDYAKSHGIKGQLFPRLRPRCPDGRCPRPQPVQPAPPEVPPPVRDPVLEPIPETEPAPQDEEEPANSSGLPLWTLLIPLLGGGFGVYSQLKSEN